MTGPRPSGAPPAQLVQLGDAAQRVAGVLAARSRGDAEGAAALLQTFPDEGALAGGAMLLADLVLGVHASETGRSKAECVQDLAVQIEHATGAARP
ncbi:hypothetical protein [Modestobacter sp. VKM Ac-2978]|uniref:hypothetical protein n=1 Tax=Modestobacter sp. VKM Ac-2978 TaxID=3004132 RepID=UPI0022AA3759|nr:hypothetical protein [Modestobacter sp. VKM Ac-2978]MCZ2849851.1 hypothetical protein [Modestobacter sp. VKM Ac-2978]